MAVAGAAMVGLGRGGRHPRGVRRHDTGDTRLHVRLLDAGISAAADIGGPSDIVASGPPHGACRPGGRGEPRLSLCTRLYAAGPVRRLHTLPPASVHDPAAVCPVHERARGGGRSRVSLQRPAHPFSLPGILHRRGGSGGVGGRAGVRRLPALGLGLPVALVLPALVLFLKTPPPYRIDDVKPVLAYLQQHRRPGDDLYVYYGAGPAITFYDDQFGIADTDYVQGRCHRGDTRSYLLELDPLRGHPRVWVLIAHAERDNIVRYLDTIGIRRDRQVAPSRTVGAAPDPAEILLYDLSAEQQLNATSAESFPIDQRWDPRTCSHGPALMFKPTRPGKTLISAVDGGRQPGIREGRDA